MSNYVVFDIYFDMGASNRWVVNSMRSVGSLRQTTQFVKFAQYFIHFWPI